MIDITNVFDITACVALAYSIYWIFRNKKTEWDHKMDAIMRLQDDYYIKKMTNEQKIKMEKYWNTISSDCEEEKVEQDAGGGGVNDVL